VPDQPAALAQEHIVQRGESFSSIAPKYHVSVKALQAANPTVNPTGMQIGQKLVIPPATAGAVNGQSVGTAPTAGNAEQTYVVKAGDNLTKIADRFGTTIAAIKRANNLTTDRIMAGDKLKIPATNGTAAPR
jgi:LysM repeat protein